MTTPAHAGNRSHARPLLSTFEFEQMVVIRRAEKAAYDLFRCGNVKGTRPLHLANAVAALGLQLTGRDRGSESLRPARRPTSDTRHWTVASRQHTPAGTPAATQHRVLDCLVLAPPAGHRASAHRRVEGNNANSA